MTKTADVLKAMLTENTGTHMLDSGGAYGRSWQQNQGRDFDAEPEATISVEEGYIDIRRSTFHFLKEGLEFDETLNARFLAFNRAKDPGDQIGWLPLMEEFVESVEATGIYGEGKPVTVNTYNHDSLVDQILQYVYFELDEQGYILLQIHGGCDARGGYTAPKAFRCNIEDSPSIFSDGDATITCKGGDHRWFYFAGGCDVDHYEDEDDRKLDEFPIIEEEIKYHKVHEIAEGVTFSIATGAAFGVIWQDAEGVHCPLCGGILEVW